MAYQIRWSRQGSTSSADNGIRPLDPTRSLTIGREVGADIQLPDSAVSRLHAEIYIEDQRVYVRDASSANGTKIDGKMVVRANWLPGQVLTVGPFRLDLTGQGDGSMMPATALDTLAGSRLANMGDDGSGRIELGDVYQRAKQNDPQAVRQLFSGFMSRQEQIVDCGYLGALGFIFPEHSFWCVTNNRACGLLMNASGRVDFAFGFLKALDVAYFRQPSLVGLWVTVIVWVLFVLSMALSAVGTGTAMWNFTSIIYGIMFYLLAVGLIAGGLLMIRWVIRAYYRFAKSGCVFFTKEHVPIFVFADRQNLKAAQRFIAVYAEQKAAIGA